MTTRDPPAPAITRGERKVAILASRTGRFMAISADPTLLVEREDHLVAGGADRQPPFRCATAVGTASAIDLPEDDVQAPDDGDDVGDKFAPRDLVEEPHGDEAGGAALDPIRDEAAVAHDVERELSPRRFRAGVGLPRIGLNPLRDFIMIFRLS